MSFYGTVGEADAYHSMRGNDSWSALSTPAKEAALVRAADYIDRFFVEKLASGRYSSLWCGKQVTTTQPRAFPRDGVTFYGEAVGDNITPTAIEEASYEAALREASTPGSLLPDYTENTTSGAVVQETVGPLTIKYSDMSKERRDHLWGGRPPNMPVIPTIDGMVAGYLCRRLEGPAVRVV